MRLALGLVLSVVAMLAVPAAAQAVCETNWVGGSGDWSVNANWDNNAPTAGTTACIEAAGNYTVTVDANGSTEGLTLGDGNAANGSPTLSIRGTTVGGNAIGTFLGIGTSTVAADGVLELASSGANPGKSTVSTGTGVLTNNGIVRTTPGPGTAEDKRGLHITINNAATGRVEINKTVNQENLAGDFTNAGTLAIAAGQLYSFSATGAGRTFTQAGGTIDNAGTFLQSNGNFVHTAGTASGNPLQLVNTNLNASGSGAASFDLVRVEGVGFISTLTGDIAADKTVRVNAESATTNGTIGTPITNLGTLILTGAGEAQLTGSQLTNAGRLRVEDGGGRVVSTRLINAAAGTTQILRATSCSCNGQTFSNAGTFAIAPSAALVMNGVSTFDQTGGTLSGGSLTVGALNNSGGALAPGASPGTFSLIGDYTQAAGGTLAIELGGTAPTAYDQLVITGKATLGGTLAVSTGSFKPKKGDAFNIVSATSLTGSFAGLTGGNGLNVGYTPSGATLVAGDSKACVKAKDKLKKAKDKLKKLKEDDAPKAKIKKAKKKVKKAKKKVKNAC